MKSIKGLDCHGVIGVFDIRTNHGSFHCVIDIAVVDLIVDTVNVDRLGYIPIERCKEQLDNVDINVVVVIRERSLGCIDPKIDKDIGLRFGVEHDAD